MLNVLMLTLGIYVALVAASLTVMAMTTSKWFMRKFTELAKNMAEVYDEIE